MSLEAPYVGLRLCVYMMSSNVVPIFFHRSVLWYNYLSLKVFVVLYVSSGSH